MQKFLEKKYQWIIGIILAFMAIISILNAKNDSLIYDEAAHIPAGYSYLTQRDMRLNPEHPPLLKDIAALPLLFLNLNFDTSQSFWTTDNANDSQWNAGKIFIFDSGNNPDKIIFWSRLPFVLLSLILGLFIFKWTRELAGLTAGIFALILYAFDPNILGHNHFVTTDLGIAAFITFTFYFFLRFVKNPSWKNTTIFGLIWGVLQLVKFSSVLTLPVFGLILIVYPLIKLNAEGQETRWKEKLKFWGEYVGKGLIAFIISLLLVWVVYYFNTSAMPKEKLPEIVNYYFNLGEDNAGKIYVRNIVSTLNDSAITRPLAVYFFGVARVFQRVAGGNATYFMGEISINKGFLSYFPIVFLIKEPFTTLILIFTSIIIVCGALLKNIFFKKQEFFAKIKDYLRQNITAFSMFLFVVLYSFVSITGRLNIGFRHLFPILPLIYILCAKILFHFVKRIKSEQSKLIFTVCLCLLSFFLILETILSYPYYTSYFNQSVGGSKNGYHYVTDSNADWGQDLNRLVIFLDNHPEIGKIRIDYFGMIDPKYYPYYFKDKYITWHSDYKPESGWYAISVNYMQGLNYDKSKSDSVTYRWLQNKKPAYQVGTSILIYYVSAEEAALVNNPPF